MEISIADQCIYGLNLGPEWEHNGGSQENDEIHHEFARGGIGASAQVRWPAQTSRIDLENGTAGGKISGRIMQSNFPEG